MAVVVSLYAASAWGTETYQFVAKWGSYGSGDGQFIGPGGLAVDASGNVYAVDYNNYRVEKFSSTGAFITKWGSYGSGDGQFTAPTGLALDASGNVYVSDDFYSSIQKFSSAGGFISKWISTGDQPYNPYGIAVDSSGNIYVTDNFYSCVQKFSSTGTFITKWGSYGSGDGQIVSPTGIAVDASGNVYVSDAGNNRIQKFALSTSPLPVSVQPVCPASVKVGQLLTVTVNLYNSNCDYPVSVNRFMARVIGNADGTLSGLGIFGPFNRALGTAKDVPPATCNTTTTPGTVPPFNLMVVNEVPASLSGKMATINIEAITIKGQTFGGGECVVRVVP